MTPTQPSELARTIAEKVSMCIEIGAMEVFKEAASKEAVDHMRNGFAAAIDSQLAPLLDELQTAKAQIVEKDEALTFCSLKLTELQFMFEGANPDWDWQDEVGGCKEYADAARAALTSNGTAVKGLVEAVRISEKKLNEALSAYNSTYGSEK